MRGCVRDTSMQSKGSERKDSEKTEDRNIYKTEGGKGSERGVVGKSSMKGKKTQLDKQRNISKRRETKGERDLE